MAYYYSPFRKAYGKQPDEKRSCVFCESSIRQQAVFDLEGKAVENEYYWWLVNFYPRFEGHTMLVPKKHRTAFSEESPQELIARQQLLVYAVDILSRLYENSGLEVFLQTGSGSEATIRHLHWHLVPAHAHDSLRSFEKLGHFTTTEEGKEKIILFPIEIRFAKEELQKALAPIVTENPYRV